MNSTPISHRPSRRLRAALLGATVAALSSGLLAGCDTDRFRCYTDSYSTGSGDTNQHTTFNCGVSYFF